MNADERAQVRLILDTLAERATAAYREKLDAAYGTFSAKGMLQSGNTIRVGVRLMGESAEQLVKDSVDQVSPISMGTDAFAMISETLELFLSSLGQLIDGIVKMAGGAQRGASVQTAAVTLFDEMATRVRKQLELHRFTFMRASSPIQITPRAAGATPPAPKAKGGRPPAEFWDDMWAAIAAQLYDGTLKPTKQVHIEKAMSDWISGHGHDAGTTTIRGRARRLWDAISTDRD